VGQEMAIKNFIQLVSSEEMRKFRLIVGCFSPGLFFFAFWVGIFTVGLLEFPILAGKSHNLQSSSSSSF
jgi:hypothetical protein